jgi:chromosome segregation ATPase
VLGQCVAPMTSTGLRPDSDLTLAVYLAPLAAGRRVLWIGSEGPGPRRLERAAAVLTVRPSREGLASLQGEGQDAYELVVIPEVEALKAPFSEVVAGAGRAASATGVVVFGRTSPSAPGLGAAEQEMLAGHFGAVKIVGQAGFAAHALAELGSARDDVVVDGTLLDEEEAAPRRLLAICGAQAAELDRYVLVPFPDESLDGGDAVVEVEGMDPDVARLEGALEDKARQVRELEREVERRGAIVRDLIEEKRAMASEAERSGGAGAAAAVGESQGALERALEAEAARAEAQFRIDELEARLSALDAETQLLREANLEGTVRGLRSRVAELEELRALAEGRFELARMDLEAARERGRRLEREMAELRDQMELEMIRTRGAEFAHRDQLDRARGRELDLAAEVAQLRGELAGARARLDEREAALETLRVAAEGAGGAASDAELEELEPLRAEREHLSARVRALEEARAEDLRALKEARDVLAQVPSADAPRPATEITAAGLDAPAATGEADVESLRAQLRSLQERAARLQEELEHERRARQSSMLGGHVAASLEELETKAQQLEAVAQQREAEAERLKGQLTSQQREAKVLRDACGEVRQELEDLLRLATESGDPAGAERLGGLLRLLGRV